MFRSGRLAAVLSTIPGLLVALLAGGCRIDGAGTDRPGAVVAVHQFAGTPLSGPTARSISVPQPQDALAVRVTVFALSRVPGDSLQPLETRAGLNAVWQGEEPIVPVAELTGGSRIGGGDEAEAFVTQLQAAATADPKQKRKLPEQVAVVESIVAALPAGVTLAVGLTASPSDSQPASGQQLTLLLSRAEAADQPIPRVQPAVEAMGLVPSSKPGEESGPPVLRRELTILDAMPADSSLRVVLVAPHRFAGSTYAAAAFAIEIAPGTSDESHVAAIQRCLADLRRSADELAPTTAAAESDGWLAISSAMESMSNASTRRAAMLFLCERTGAAIGRDIVLSGNDAILELLAAAVVAKSPRSPDALGWAIDQGSLELLARLYADNRLPPEMLAVLSLHCGEAGRNPANVGEIAQGLTNRQDLENRLVAENLIALEDSSPAARVRAFDWLSARKLAPPDYDPLASDAARRAALDAALNAATLNQP